MNNSQRRPRITHFVENHFVKEISGGSFCQKVPKAFVSYEPKGLHRGGGGGREFLGMKETT
jgi:hypothetical protein